MRATTCTRRSANFTYLGGPIIADPQAYTSFWGDWSTPEAATRQTNLVQFVQDFLRNTYMNILSQYGVGNGAGQCGRYMNSANLPGSPGM